MGGFWYPHLLFTSCKLLADNADMAVDWDCFEAGVENAEQVAAVKCIEPLFQNVVTALVALAGVALFLILIVSGYTYLFAGGDMKKLEKAKGSMTGAFMGLVVIVAAYLIIRLVQEITGVTNLTNFKITIPGP